MSSKPNVHENNHGANYLMPPSTKSYKTPAHRAVAKIFLLDRRIRYCAVVNHKGEVIAGGIRPGLTQLVPPEEMAKLHIQETLHRSMHEGWDRFLGRVNVTIVQRQKNLQIRFFLASGRNLAVSAEPDCPFSMVEELAKFVDTLNLEG